MRLMVTINFLVCKISINCWVAGYTYCAIAALSFVNRLPDSVPSEVVNESTSSPLGLTNIPATIRWLVSRQVRYPENEDEVEVEIDHKPSQVKLAGVYEDKPLVPDLSLEEAQFVGFNGRCNKRVDTCYAFWVTASLEVSLPSLTTKRLITEGLKRYSAKRIPNF
jgi:geranylgeranyl transferase type-1 subunit beta